MSADSTRPETSVESTAPAVTPGEWPACQIHPAPAPMERRSFLVWLASAVLALAALFTGATVVQALVPPNRSIDGKTKVGKLAVGKLDALPIGKPVTANYGDNVLFLVRKSANEVVVLSQTCPHVGCKLAFNAATKQFDCPCHASHFSLYGKKLGGPAPRDMYAADFTVVNGEIVVSGIIGQG